MELNKMTLTDLRRTLKRVEAEIERRTNSAKKDVLRQVQKLAQKAGLSMDELIGTKPSAPAAPRKAGRKTAAPRKAAGARKSVGVAKYRNPANAEQTWTGKGRKPAWVQEWLAANKPLADLEIKG